MDMNNTTSDKNVAQDIEFLKSNEADALYFRGNPKLKSAVESVLERNKELEEVIENSIPTQKVKDKIEEYNKKMEEDAGHPNWVVTDKIVMNVLQELLEGGK